MQMLKVKPHADYPTEEGRYLRGNDFSPAAVAIILNQDDDKIPRDIQALVQAGLLRVVLPRIEDRRGRLILIPVEPA